MSTTYVPTFDFPLFKSDRDNQMAKASQTRPPNFKGFFFSLYACMRLSVSAFVCVYLSVSLVECYLVFGQSTHHRRIITVRLVFSLTGLDLTKQENM